MLSTVCSFVHLVPNMWTQYFKNECIDFDANDRLSVGQGHATVHFVCVSGCQEVKVQGHTRQNIDLEAWQRHYSENFWNCRPVSVILDLPGKQSCCVVVASSLQVKWCLYKCVIYTHMIWMLQHSDYDQLLEAYNASQQSLQQSACTISVSVMLNVVAEFVIFLELSSNWFH